jgi:DNA-directed RNA polymerase specialized sigma24 family protein
MLLSLHHVFLKPQWDVLELRYRDGMETREIARALGITPAAVRARARRAWKKVQEKSARRNGAKRSET